MTATIGNIYNWPAQRVALAPLLAALLFSLPLSLTLPGAGAANAQSADAQSMQDGILVCQRIEKRKARYRCYDALESGDAVESGDTVPAVAAAIPDPVAERRDFGQPEYAREKKGIETLTVQIVSATLGRSGKWTFRTSDGQIWRQVNAKRVRFSKQNFEAEISKAPLAGFYFRVPGKKLRLRVKRIK